MVSAFIGTSQSTTRTITAILGTESGYIIIRGSELPLDWHRNVCLNYQIPAMRDFIENIL